MYVLENKLKNPKTKKALRKIEKRRMIAQKKNTISSPKNIRYTFDKDNECIIVTGEIDKRMSAQLVEKCYVRFKLSGQKEFLPFGYQSKIEVSPTSNQFKFEVLLTALDDEDEISIQAFNDKGQTSNIVTCQYLKKELSAIIKPAATVFHEHPLKRVSKYKK